RSRAAFRRGVAELRAEDWAGARASFEEAWSLVQHPSILLNLGIARLRTDDPVLAEQDLVRFLSEDSGATSEELASAREALGEARSRIGTLRVIATPASARVVIDGQPASVRAPTGAGRGGVAEARLKAGEHTVVVEADGFLADRRSVEVLPKSETELEVALVGGAARTARSEGMSTRAIVGWSLAGVSGVALAASGVMALRAMSLSNDYADRASPSFQDRDVKDEGIAFRTGADVALVTALLAGAGAVVLLFTDIGASSDGGVARVDARRPALVRW
ncbi:MAG: PEGA domain-containing protein, partial [Labilithrix sp.]|nr:PEGA domain-containing protein [Labilithrix sp.]